MRSSRRTRPEVLTLEGRTLMSGTSARAPATAEHSARPAHGISVVLNGRTTDLVKVDKQGIAHVTGSGHMSGLGQVSISGTVNTKAENALLATPGELYANLVISTPKGEINVHVTPGTLGLNPFAQPVHMQYALAGGTGAFHHATGKGLVDVNLYQAIPSNLTALKQMGVRVDFAKERLQSRRSWPGFSSGWVVASRAGGFSSRDFAAIGCWAVPSRPARQNGKRTKTVRFYFRRIANSADSLRVTPRIRSETWGEYKGQAKPDA